MSDNPNEFGGTFWGKSLDDVDREVARLAAACNVRILDSGVIERVLQKRKYFLLINWKKQRKTS